MIDHNTPSHRAERAAKALRAKPVRQRAVPRGSKTPLATLPRQRRRPPRRKPIARAGARIRPLLRIVASNPAPLSAPRAPRFKSLRLVGPPEEFAMESSAVLGLWPAGRPAYSFIALVLAIVGGAAVAMAIGRLLTLPL